MRLRFWRKKAVSTTAPSSLPSHQEQEEIVGRYLVAVRRGRNRSPIGPFRDLEAEFIEIAKEYAETNGIEWLTFREFGVLGRVLERAGLSPPPLRRAPRKVKT